jgi:hypothetical protein
MRPLMAQKVATPPQIEEQLGGALLIECYRIGNCAVILSRSDVADGRNRTRDFRWHLELSHAERSPTWDEIEIARGLLPEEVHFCLPFPRAGFRPKEGLSLHFWEVKDDNLTEQWEYDSVVHRD